MKDPKHLTCMRVIVYIILLLSALYLGNIYANKNQKQEKMNTLIKSSQFENQDHYERIYGVVQYINILQEGMFRDDELDAEIPEAQMVYFVDYYFCEVENGGFKQYFANSKFNKTQNDIVVKGLKNMQAYKNAALFLEATQILHNVDASELEEYLYADIYDEDEINKKPGIQDVHDALNHLTDVFFTLQKDEAILELNYNYIAHIPNLKVLKDKEYDNEVHKILLLVTDFEERKLQVEREWQQNKPRYYKVAEILCNKYNLELISINALDYGEGIVSDEQAKKNHDNGIEYYHITTDKGYYYIIDDMNLPILLGGKDNKIVGKISNAEIR